MITNETSGVWELWDTYAKRNAERWIPDANLLFGWGSGGSGQLGQSNTTDYSSPVQIPGTIWNSISAGYLNSAAIKTDGTLWSWGRNEVGQLGQNNTTYRSSPVQIPGNTWSSISVSNFDSRASLLATKTDGTLWVWGYNVSGQLGQNNRTVYSSPTQIPGTTWSSISVSKVHSLATKTDGTLWSWGTNSNGELGQSNRTGYSSPVQIPGNTWSSISSGNYFSLATKTDGTLWSWGSNGYGQLGQNNRTVYSSPTQIPGTTWSSISAGGPAARQYSAATKTDGTLWTWGFNDGGQLGINNRTQYSSPNQVPGTTWNKISNGAHHSLAIKTDGTLWSWGGASQYNNTGQLGQNDTIKYSSPVQIPGTNWINISAGGLNSQHHSLATKLTYS